MGLDEPLFVDTLWNGDLAELYRRGLLTTEDVMIASAGGGDEASMVQRGLYMLFNVLCAEIDSPPPGVADEAVISEPGLSQRSYAEDRVAHASCGGCHGQLDPLAYAFEPWDQHGRFRTHDAHGNALRSDGAIWIDGAEQSYADAEELAAIFATSRQAHACFVHKALQYAWGTPTLDRCVIDAIAPTIKSYKDVLRAIVSHPSFEAPR